MTQNIYDNDEFFQGYSRLLRSTQGLDGAPEWATLRAWLPPLRGRRVLDLGCGFGWFCRYAHAEGAAQVVGIDVSENMLARARAESDPAIEYVHGDLDALTLEAGSYDLVYSSLALHYLKHLDALVGEVHRALVPGGSFVFSAEHPIYTAPSAPGWQADALGRKTWPVDGYLNESARSTDWLTKGVIKQHRTIGTYVNLLLRAGFTLTQLEEWGPSAEQIAAHPEWASERERPPFLLVAAQR